LNVYTDLSGFTQEGTGPTSFLYGGGTNRLHQVYADLKAVPHISVYLKDEIPERLHYKNNNRIKDLLLIADEGWSILDIHNPKPEKYIGGTHGYDNELFSMHAIFIANGPAFKKGYSRDTVENIDIYPLISHLLQLTPNQKIDGDLDRISDVLLKED
jgi:predicted AlkP superfamily pyrophosphatase or phosphodiesterase